MLISICICTWNREALLDQTLEAMRELRIPEGTDWEVLVVNNRCTDGTDDVLSRHEANLPLRRLFEPRQGLSHARNTAVAAARGDLILWTDDDVVVDPEWLAEYVEVATRYPQALYFGGTVDPWFSIEPPGWIRRNLGSLIGPFAMAQLGEEVRPLEPSEYVTGANMAFRREAFETERYNPNLGRVASSLISCDDLEFVARLKAEGSLGLWVGTAKVRHYIPAERLTKSYIRRWYRGFGTSQARRDGARSGVLLFGMPRWALRAFGESVFGYLGFQLSGGLWGLRGFSQVVALGAFLEESKRLSSQKRPPIATRERSEYPTISETS